MYDFDRVIQGKALSSWKQEGYKEDNELGSSCAKVSGEFTEEQIV